MDEESFLETDLLLPGMEPAHPLRVHVRANGSTEPGYQGNPEPGQQSIASTDDEMLDIRTDALEHWNDSDEDEQKIHSSKLIVIVSI